MSETQHMPLRQTDLQLPQSKRASLLLSEACQHSQILCILHQRQPSLSRNLWLCLQSYASMLCTCKISQTIVRMLLQSDVHCLEGQPFLRLPCIAPKCVKRKAYHKQQQRATHAACASVNLPLPALAWYNNSSSSLLRAAEKSNALVTEEKKLGFFRGLRAKAGSG